MFTITAERARYYAGRDYVDNLVEIDLMECMSAIIRDSGDGYRFTDVKAPKNSDRWNDPKGYNDRRIERVIDELRDRGFCVVRRYVYRSSDERDCRGRSLTPQQHYYHIEW